MHGLCRSTNLLSEHLLRILRHTELTMKEIQWP